VSLINQRLGWDEFFEAQLDAELALMHVGRLVEEQRGRFRVAGGFQGWAELSGRLRHDAISASDLPAVGDWVGVKAEAGADVGVIQRRLDRRGVVSRKAVGRASEEQVIAANVDTVFLVTALTPDLSARRLERYLMLVREAGATPVVVMNKADLSADPIAETESLRARLPLVDVISVSALRSEGLDQLLAYLHPGRTIALLGSSGVGKSTLVNRLLGRDAFKVAAVRESDEKGRHTTTSRHLVELPGGALLIDTPGMRELQPWVDETVVSETFTDIAELATGCRFTDCGHVSEPGCAVLHAAETGALDAERLESYRQLLREVAFEERKRDMSAAAAEKERWKKAQRAQKALYKDRNRG
jgi:ribosome biogenesis GTPase